MSGTLTKLDWRNPHIELIVDRKGDGDQVEVWSIEGPLGPKASFAFAADRIAIHDAHSLAGPHLVKRERSRTPLCLVESGANQHSW